MNLSKKYLVIIIICFAIITISAVINIYDKIEILDNKFKDPEFWEYDDYNKMQIHKKFAEEIINQPGYILYFRHAEREKWLDVQSYDAYELEKNIKAENSNFANAVCLSVSGKIQAKLIGDYFDLKNIKIHKIVSSPSCRARQTAAAIGQIDSIKNILVHHGPWFEDFSEFQKKIKQEFLNTEIKKGYNTIIVGHNSVISDEIFDENYFAGDLSLAEGGFAMIKKEDDKLILIHKFKEFMYFSSSIMDRPLN